ncbi:MAG: 3-isopropylmalate dehydratase [Chloroflexi bacterium]|nr:3-isopropylmalate dehydratase [Chloroflexota bacterium]
MKATQIKGCIWVLTDPDGKLYDDVDTDMIFHNSHLHITDVEEMGQYALGNLEGWEDFAEKAQPGDIILAGKNFGAGSSRQQAVDCFRALGIGAIVAESFGAIYKRNAINSGFPIVSLPGLTERLGLSLSKPGEFKTGAELEVDFETGQLSLYGGEVLDDGRRSPTEPIQAQPFSQVQMDIFQAGNLFAYGKSLGG